MNTARIGNKVRGKSAQPELAVPLGGGYDDDAKCRQIALEGSISLTEFQSRLPALPKSQEIIFFCA